MSKRWTQEEDEYLLANYKQREGKFLSEVLGRSTAAINSRHVLLKKKEREQPPKELEYILSRAERSNPKRLRKKKSKKGTIENTKKLSSYRGTRGNAYSHTKSGYRHDLGINVRSGWEANVLRVLQSYEIPFEFEPTIFRFPIKRGNKAYTPDILLTDSNEWIEVKGYLDKNSETKLKRFKKYYPEDFATLTMIIGKSSRKNREFCKTLGVPTVLYYEELSKLFKPKIPTWEGR